MTTSQTKLLPTTSPWYIGHVLWVNIQDSFDASVDSLYDFCGHFIPLTAVIEGHIENSLYKCPLHCTKCITDLSHNRSDHEKILFMI